MPQHAHSHSPGCGHTPIEHEGHVDYLHDGQLHHQEGDLVEEHVVAVDSAHPDGCHHIRGPVGHEQKHSHGPGCGHEAVPHGDHIDYLVDGRLHHPHGDHCDDHGAIQLATAGRPTPK